ncbi:transcriptional regulator, partial [Candidatus Endoriftia persephone str. Guaymas]|nr:transcriptional regulator [Candidatus Endoriftia persephone str. Guaymas]
MLATSAIASEVTIPNTFSAGSPAVASEVNANFSAVKTAVDDNNRRADELEALANKLDSDMTAALTEANNRLSALESQLAQMVGGSGAALTQASLTGVYKFIY